MLLGAVSVMGVTVVVVVVAALLMPANSATGITEATITRAMADGRIRDMRRCFMDFLSWKSGTSIKWDLGPGLQTLIRFLMHASPSGRSN
jgi:hypothetical protein